MITVNYLSMLVLVSAGVVPVALACLAIEAYVTRDLDQKAVGALPPRGRFAGLDYNKDGYVVLHSRRNTLVFAGIFIAAIWAAGLWYWDSRDAVLATVCRNVVVYGVKPLFCL